ncbi:MAG TPA: hypothetical protein P5052_03185 [Candidatus Paceibacterota bacterium]|nr:hypothetical protein [Candidatus Paceibacterota bacterium]
MTDSDKFLFDIILLNFCTRAAVNTAVVDLLTTPTSPSVLSPVIVCFQPHFGTSIKIIPLSPVSPLGSSPLSLSGSVLPLSDPEPPPLSGGLEAFLINVTGATPPGCQLQLNNLIFSGSVTLSGLSKALQVSK